MYVVISDMGKVKAKKVSAAWARRQRKKNADINPEQVAQDENQNEVDEGEPGETEMNLDDQKIDDPGTSSNVQARKRSRRQPGEVLWEDDNFPQCSNLLPSCLLSGVWWGGSGSSQQEESIR